MTRCKVLMQFTSTSVPGSGHSVWTRRLSFWPLSDLQHIWKHISSYSLINQQTGMKWQPYASLLEASKKPEVWVDAEGVQPGHRVEHEHQGYREWWDCLIWCETYTLSNPWVVSNLLFGIKAHLASCKFEWWSKTLFSCICKVQSQTDGGQTVL